MFRNYFIRQVPKKSLVALAMLVVALAAGGMNVQSANAGPTTPYQIEITWDRVTWEDMNDGWLDYDLEIYGILQASNQASGVLQERMMGDFGNPGRCGADTWDGNGPCWKRVDEFETNLFALTPMSANTVTGQPNSNHAFFNNKVFLSVRPGEKIRLFARLFDYDAASANDPACVQIKDLIFTEAQLQTLNTTETLRQSNITTACSLTVKIRRS